MMGVSGGVASSFNPLASAELKLKDGRCDAPDFALRCENDVEEGGDSRLECIEAGRLAACPGRGVLSELSFCGTRGKENSRLGFISILGTPPDAIARLPILSMLLLEPWPLAKATSVMFAIGGPQAAA